MGDKTFNVKLSGGIGIWFLALCLLVNSCEYNSHWEMIEKCRLMQDCKELEDHAD